MAGLLAHTASASELSLHPWIGAVSFIVADLAAVVAFASQPAAATFALLRAVARKMSLVTAAGA